MGIGKKKHLKENLIKLLNTQGLNTTELASRTKLPRTTIQKLLGGSTKNPRNTTLTTIAKFFNTTIENLLYGEVLKSTKEAHWVPLIKKSEITEWLAQKNNQNTFNNALQIQIATSRNASEKAFAIICNETGNTVFKNGSHLIFDPNTEPLDDSYVLIKPFDNNELLFRQITVDIGVIFVKPILSQFSTASKVRPNDKIIATLIQIQTNFEEL